MEPATRRPAPGRLPERVYWFRRAVVLVALALVIALLMWLVSLLGGSSTGTPTATLAPPSASVTPSVYDSLQATALPAPDTTAASPSPGPSASESPSASSTPSAPAAPAECDPALLALAVNGPGQVKAGATATFAITVTNTGTGSCTFTFDSRFTMRIVSGTDEVWSTADCAQWAPTGTQALAPGAAATWQTSWDRHRSQAPCKVVPTTLKAGTYVAGVSYTGAATAQLVMLLTA